MSISVTDIANEIFVELDQSTDVSIPEVAFWLRAHIGDLNNLILTAFTIDPITLEISPTTSFGEDEKSIFKGVYYLKYYETLARRLLGAAGIQTTIEWSSDGHSIRKINRGTLAQIYNQVRKELKDELMSQVNFYKINRATPKSIEGQEVNELIVWPARYNRILNQGL